ncbi:TetR/AcrR family transcriptional regulator [Gulosibacter sp. 10]|uniref:TetR/AcrR family transcriptional regulator n=1 Tax=Gulosibacter sp. 10 TaxID=1255570 RepID=UPI00097F0BD7|nr:TetR/AcrR family transcriptional regulator [Gulosibacter sp. 10]SJM68773.1 Transcriptional regulator, TetR family [Gulosibacter sp. 10]
MSTRTAQGRPRSFDRDAALDRAIRLFWRKGYEATSVRDLSEELGIGQPSLYNAFGSKRALFDEAIRVYDQAYGDFMNAAIREEATAVGAMRRILTEAPGRYTRRGLPRGCLLGSGDAGTDDEEVRASLSHLRGEKDRALRERVDADIAAGRLSPEVDPVGLVGYVMSMIGGLVQRARDGASRRELDAIVQVALAALPD